MKVNIKVKCVNPHFDRKFADEVHDGKESEDNILYLWEDEFDVSGDVEDFKVRNNVSYTLAGTLEDGKAFKHEIPGMTILECKLKEGTLAQFPISKKLIKDTEKKVSKDGEKLSFLVFLRGNARIVNPFEGAYFLKQDFPFDIEEAEASEEEDEEDRIHDENG